MRGLLTLLFISMAALSYCLSIVYGPPFTFLAIASGILYIWYNIFLDKKYLWTSALFGASCNLLAVSVNGGQMPVLNAPFAMDAAHSVMTTSSHLKFLCDIIPVGQWAIISVGDLFICVGTLLTILIYLVYKITRGRNGTERT